LGIKETNDDVTKTDIKNCLGSVWEEGEGVWGAVQYVFDGMMLPVFGLRGELPVFGLRGELPVFSLGKLSVFSLRGAVCVRPGGAVCVQPEVGSACGERLPVFGPGVGAACAGPAEGGGAVCVRPGLRQTICLEYC
jgi:hypothetical protein